MPIRPLPPLLVNQIAAGEVIERPANVVKELVENALDAGASRITVSIEAGGRELIEIVDDGHGIPADELPLAVAPHATSKIATSEDLARIETLGFRGEALASIGSVSRLRIVSRTGDAESAASIAVEGDRVEQVRPASGAPGTTVSIRNLFFNTPARRKFLKSDSTEAGRIAEMVSTIAMAHPSVAFRLRQDGRVTLDLAPASPRSRVTTIVGGVEPNQLLEAVDSVTGGGSDGTPTAGAWLRVWGVVGTPALARHNGRYVRLFLNGRPIVDRTVAHAVREAYRGLIDPTRFPTAAVFLTADPSEVDVNVHPAKSEVRFRNVSAVHSMVHATVKAALRRADLVPALELHGADAPETLPSAPDMASPGAGWSNSAAVSRPSGDWRGTGSSSPAWPRTQSSGFSLAEARAAMAQPPRGQFVANERYEQAGQSPLLQPPAAAVRVLQVHDKYVIVEDAEGMVVIDQHALHERVMFEKLHRRFVAGALESQRLLVPADLAADAARLEALERVRGLLLRLGIDAEPSGPASIAIHAFPSALFGRRVEPVAFLIELLDRAANADLPPSEEAALVEVLSMMACKAAIKAGDRLAPGELDELLRLRETVERSTACPHGRPTSLRVSLKELDRQFGR